MYTNSSCAVMRVVKIVTVPMYVQRICTLQEPGVASARIGVKKEPEANKPIFLSFCVFLALKCFAQKVCRQTAISSDPQVLVL
jgi:hypothetical protein